MSEKFLLKKAYFLYIFPVIGAGIMSLSLANSLAIDPSKSPTLDKKDSKDPTSSKICSVVIPIIQGILAGIIIGGILGYLLAIPLVGCTFTLASIKDSKLAMKLIVLISLCGAALSSAFGVKEALAKHKKNTDKIENSL